MPAKDITTFEDQYDAAETVAEDILNRWKVWNELAKKELGEMSSPYMLIATQLMGQAMMAMLCAQVPEAVVAKDVERLFDLYTDPDVMAQIAAMRDDKKEIIAFCDRILQDQIKGLAKHRAIN